jgi:hypothetical protein
MWRLAYQMARSGKHSNWMSIEWELTKMGFGHARILLDTPQVREKLDRLCRDGQRGY